MRRHGQVVYDRRRLEVCIFSQLAAEFKSGDLSVPGSHEFADLREQLVPWEDCAPLVVNYCQAVHLPATGAAFVQELREELTQLARQVDERILSDGHVEISADGEITLKKRPTPEPSGAGKALAEAMPPLLP